MAVAQRPWSQRAGNALTPLNAVSACLLVAAGWGLSRLLVAPRFGLTLVFVSLLATIPLAMVLILKPRLGIYSLFVISMVIIEIKRLAWYTEVGLVIEFLEGALGLGLALSIVARRDAWRLRSPLTAPVLVYLAYQLLLSFHPNLPTTENVIYALRDVVNFSVPFFAALYFIRERSQLRHFLYLWLGTAVVIALYGLKQRFLGLTHWESAWLTIAPTHVVYDQVRIFSTLGSADDLGMHMAISIVIALGVAFYVRGWKARYAACAMVPLFAAATLYTLTRGAYVAVLVGAIGLALLTRNRAMFLAMPVLATLVLGWYQLNQGSVIANRVLTMFAPEQDESFAIRQSYVEDYTPLILDNPFGFGPATTGRQGWILLERSGVDPRLAETLAGIPADNYYFRIGLENGWVGLLLFIGLLAATFIVGWRIYTKARDPLIKGVAASLLASYLAMAISSLSNNYFSHVDLKLFFWFTLGILAKLPEIERTPEQPPTVKRPVLRYAGAGGEGRW